MHEMAIATDLLDQLTSLGREHRLARVTRVVVQHGSLRLIVPEALHMAFLAASPGTVAEGAELILEEVEPVAKCRLCQQTFHPPIDDFRCPDCAVADVDIIAGDDIMLHTVDGEPAVDTDAAPTESPDE